MASYPNSSIYDRAGEAARFITSRTSLEPKIAVVLGSGLGGFASQLEDPVAFPSAKFHTSRSRRRSAIADVLWLER
jgi:purine nucleoside phosphorylase